jgi:hypothetical protein
MHHNGVGRIGSVRTSSSSSMRWYLNFCGKRHTNGHQARTKFTQSCFQLKTLLLI